MNQRAQRRGAAACLLAGSIAFGWHTEIRAGNARDADSGATHLKQPATSIPSDWDSKAAAAYLDQRANWWMEWPKAARDHGTFCVSCHTAVPYAMSRPVLRKALAENSPSVTERKLLENVSKRVRMWKEVAPFYSDADRGAYKTVESRGTESVLNALTLASRDQQGGRLNNETRMALDNMWAEQQNNGGKKGAWAWLRFANQPWEADDSDFYGAALAAIAVGTAPENYAARPEIQENMRLLRAYLNRECAAQVTINRAVFLWASARVPGLLEPEQQRAIIREVLEKQRPDGGWSLASLIGDWKRHDGTPQELKSDGYATGLITFALQQVGISRENEQEKKGLAWLASNQNHRDGYWPAYSLNNNSEHHMAPATVRFMNDAATAYAVLALSEANRQSGNNR
jgi:squalene-hopene/tetraprenyl-beta-curcumene cyclase